MKKKLNCILLIDDDDATNFIHKIVIKKTECAEKVVAVTDGQAALDFLTSTEDGKHPQPDLIFLDINMPIMDGWEFLDNYEQLNSEQKAKIVIIMLTTSLNPDDRSKAEILPNVSSFMSKPLTEEMLAEILEEYFP